MTFAERINSLRPQPNGAPLVLDLFAGCGGLALGFETHGFATLGFEQEVDACETYRRNLKGKCEQITLTPGTRFQKAEVIIGGPPCQPFSVGGHQMGLEDSRDGFPIFISAIKQAEPEIWMFENVRGVLYSNRWYFDQILEALKALNYVIEVQLINAVNYGVPQNRERVIVVGHRGEFRFPNEESNRISASAALEEWMLQAPEGSKFPAFTRAERGTKNFPNLPLLLRGARHFCRFCLKQNSKITKRTHFQKSKHPANTAFFSLSHVSNP